MEKLVDTIEFYIWGKIKVEKENDLFTKINMQLTKNDAINLRDILINTFDIEGEIE